MSQGVCLIIWKHRLKYLFPGSSQIRSLIKNESNESLASIKLQRYCSVKETIKHELSQHCEAFRSLAKNIAEFYKV